MLSTFQFLILSNFKLWVFLIISCFSKILNVIILCILYCLLACLACYFYHLIFVKILFTLYPQLSFVHFICCCFQYLQLNFQFAYYYFEAAFSITLIDFKHFIIRRFLDLNSYLFLTKYSESHKFIFLIFHFPLPINDLL